MSWTLDFESGANGDAATTANTATDSTPFTTGGTAAISTAQAFAGTRSLLLTNSTANGILAIVKSLTASGTLTLDVYFYWTALPSAEVTLARVYDTGNATCWSVNADGSGHVRFRDSAGTQQAISASGAQSMSTGQWSHLKITATAGTSTGTMQVQYFVGSSTTASYDTGALTGQAMGSNWATLRVGTKVGTSTATGTAYLDSVTGNEAAAGGTSNGAALAPASSTASAVGMAADAEVVIGSIGPASGTGTAVPVSSPSFQQAALAVARSVGKAVPLLAASVPVLTATADPLNSPPRIILTVGSAIGSTVTVRRVDDQGNTITVRSADPAPLTAGSWVGFDYEAPFNTPVTYTASTDGVNTATLTTTVELDVTRSWLIHPGIPAISIPIEVSQMPAPTRPSGRGLYQVLGRAEAVARSDGQRKARTFDLAVRTYTADDEDALNTLVDDDSVVLLQIADPRIYRPFYAWVSIGDMAGAPMATYAEGYYDWTLPCVEAARPSGLLQAERTWADVVAEFPTWADVIATYATWRDVITDTRITS